MPSPVARVLDLLALLTPAVFSLLLCRGLCRGFRHMYNVIYETDEITNSVRKKELSRRLSELNLPLPA